MDIIFGNIDEIAESLKLDVDFLLKYDDQAQMRTIRLRREITASPSKPHPSMAMTMIPTPRTSLSRWKRCSKYGSGPTIPERTRP